MKKVLTIVLLYICSVSFIQGSNLSSQAAMVECEQLSSRYVEQLDCQHRCNNFAHRSESFSIPSTTVTSLGVKSHQYRTLTGCATLFAHTSAANYYCTQFSLYTICGRRAIDYYLYTLCQLRL